MSGADDINSMENFERFVKKTLEDFKKSQAGGGTDVLNDPEDIDNVFVFEPPNTCELCEETTTSLCSICKCRTYCCRDHQKQDWIAGHKAECKLLAEVQNVKQAPVLGYDDVPGYTFGMTDCPSEGSNPSCNIPICPDGRIRAIWVMERFEAHGNESNRWVPLAYHFLTSEKPSRQEIALVISSSMIRPAYDTMVGGPRRPALARVDYETVSDKKMAADVATVLKRLGSRVRKLEAVSTPAPNIRNTWNDMWFRVQFNLSMEGIDDFDLSLIKHEKQRLKPILPNGMAFFASLASAAVTAEEPDYDTSTEKLVSNRLEKTVLRKPFMEKSDGERKTTWIVGCKDSVIYVYNDNKELIHHAKVKLQKYRLTPRPEVVRKVLYDAVMKVGSRPISLMVGQPSICSHQDVRLYEKALNHKCAKERFIMTINRNLEVEFFPRLIPLWRQTGEINE
uniref:MYND-type domain-containing protein n=1 Tax=Leptocylindrus danicus TaxID=163516 RepID=A0A7S2PP26_9STRA|mmetsp:Transcript_6475/g.9559  ORF Transcript_6475/g.9559 Transcript_6475/m.9559 type:complete len:451 (+) Transcript_6475:156-1508(+)|eukprot:CAMPEP_0116012006 /NCGR_PEP_ID=MMETSP0321-20121206/4882_1 /TAXON_ID=163516 /ORGANISM="Leptocylindrus danicus var. danicus, Strain B650" /LENGTH=450 /DNA_ID=CAMNT_0003481299 /DNA_START=239 /DNA_END=1591 /DNA_ORIENTATION=+